VNRRVALIPFLIVLAGSAVAQMGGSPGPEVKKLDYFVGTWTTEGMIAQGPWGAGGKFTGSGTTEWMPGNFFVQTHSEAQMPAELGGESKSFMIMGYDTQQGSYTSDRYSSLGQHESSKGTLSSDTWTWTSSANYGGMEIQQKLTIKTLSPTSYTMKFEISMDGKTWSTFMDGKATKK
jgi:Protein of unknown function (DUF1579)